MPNEPCGNDVCISPKDLKMMGERIDQAKAECASLRTQLAEATAACAAMREALEAYRHSYWLEADHKAGLHAIQVTSKTMELADAALSSSAGKATLEYIKGLEGFLAEVRGRYETALAEGIDRVIVRAAEGGGAGKTLADIVTRRFMAAIAFEPEFYLKEAGKDA